MPKIKTVRGIENRKVVSQKKMTRGAASFAGERKKFSILRDALSKVDVLGYSMGGSVAFQFAAQLQNPKTD